jgi:hypothetical protein
MRHHTLLAALAIVAVAALSLVAPPAGAADLNFAGSAQLDEFFVPTQGKDPTPNPGATPYGFDGLTLETSLKLAADVSDHVSANIKVCFGCHGFELDMAYLDYRVADELNFRAGRFSPTFGSFNLRHDVGNHKLSDKPLPYDMGRMLRLRTWNLGVLPSPFPDTGIEIDGTHWFGSDLQFDYAVYAVQGFRATGAHPLDIDFRLSHAFPQTYYVDNNGRPTVGARVDLTARLGEQSDLTVGASGMYGTYDTADTLSYAIWGGDVSLRVARTFLRIEYLARRTQVDTSDPSQFLLTPLAPGDAHFIKHGGYAELEQPLFRWVDLILRFDGLWRIGNAPATPLGATDAEPTQLSRHSWIARYTVGTNWAIERSLRIKLSGELWKFREVGDDGRTDEVAMHASLVGTF